MIAFLAVGLAVDRFGGLAGAVPAALALGLLAALAVPARREEPPPSCR